MPMAVPGAASGSTSCPGGVAPAFCGRLPSGARAGTPAASPDAAAAGAAGTRAGPSGAAAAAASACPLSLSSDGDAAGLRGVHARGVSAGLARAFQGRRTANPPLGAACGGRPLAAAALRVRGPWGASCGAAVAAGATPSGSSARFALPVRRCLAAPPAAAGPAAARDSARQGCAAGLGCSGAAPAALSRALSLATKPALAGLQARMGCSEGTLVTSISRRQSGPFARCTA